MDRKRILEQIHQDNDLLSLPQTISQLLEAIDSSNLRSDLLAKIILCDPALTSRLLKLANSPFYSRFSRSTTVHQAVQVLGFATVKCLALSSSILNPAQLNHDAKVDAKQFFSGVLSVAVASQKIARGIGIKATEEAFIAGLLHHVGILFFAHHYPASYREVVEHKTHSATLIEAEKLVFGIDHAEVAQNLATRWNLPVEIASSIGNHHQLDQQSRDKSLGCVLKLASLIGHDGIAGYEMDPMERIECIHKLCGQLDISEKLLEEITVSVMPDTVALSSFLETDIGSTEEILIRANKEIWRSFLTVQKLFKERQELSKQLLLEERTRGAVESKNIAIATLSHYINNSSCAWYGHIQILRQKLDSGDAAKVIDSLPSSLMIMENAIKKTLAVIAEIKEI